MLSIKVPSEGLRLSEMRKIAEGSERSIYVCDAFPDLVFKLQKEPHQRRLKRFDMKSFLLRRLDGFNYFIVRQEYKAYVKMCVRVPHALDPCPVAKFYGFIASDHGVLQVCEKVALADGTIGPTLGVAARDKTLTALDLAALGRFAVSLLEAQIPTNDINPSNIVKGVDADGAVRFVLVDGIGDIHVIPIRTYSQRARRAHLIKAFEKFKRIGLTFDHDTFGFGFAISD